MFILELLGNSAKMIINVLLSAWYTAPLITLIWTSTLLQEKRRLPRLKEDFTEFKSDLAEFIQMNVLVFIVFVAQIVVVNFIFSLFGLTNVMI